jgi:hypothetical protein
MIDKVRRDLDMDGVAQHGRRDEEDEGVFGQVSDWWSRSV